MFLLYEAAPGYTPILIVATLYDKPVAKLLSVLRKHTYILPTFLGKRCEVYGIGEYMNEEIYKKEDIFKEMLAHLTNEAMRHAFIIEFRNLENSLDGYKHFRANQYFAINWLRVRNSLHDTAVTEEYFSPSRIKQIKKGLSNGATIRETTCIKEIKEFSNMIHRVYSSRIRRYFPLHSFFDLMNDYLINKGLAKIYIVTYKGKIIGGSSCLFSEGNAYLWFSGGMKKFYAPQYPGILAVWAALQDARKNGYRHLEFMDVGLPFKKHSYRNFILHFGGKQSSTRRWFRFRWDFLNNILQKIYS